MRREDIENQPPFHPGALMSEPRCSGISLSDIFQIRNGSYLNEFTLFLAHFNTIPHFIHEINIDCKKANFWFQNEYKDSIRDFHYSKRYFNGSLKAEVDDIFFLLPEDLLVYFDTNRSTVRFLFKKTEISEVEKVMKEVRRFRKRKGKSEINLITESRIGFETVPLQISRGKINLHENYNDDFPEIHQTILKRLTRRNDKGLVLLHGKPGTGKTHYIRYLVSLIKKKVIFLPPNMASSITNPELISILTENPNSVFVIEDAEKIIIDRNKDEHSPVSVLLNLSDGLLSDCLNIQVVCTFNTDISMIDHALLRKGRLIARYEFKELSVEKSRQLSEKLGFSSEILTPLTLSTIYNQGEREFYPEMNKKRLGFTSN